ncbi:MAG: O-antigen ligase family protein, partial [Chloroflexota bacterium]|nr:O-antigen ligase family protein [Chloroflexota bacterium]
PAEPERTGRASRRVVPVAETPLYSWAVVANGVGILLVQMLAFYFALKLMAGLPFPDARMWWVLPVAILTFYAGCWALEWLGGRSDDPAQVNVYLPAIGIILLLAALLALPFNWSIDRTNQQSLITQFNVDGIGFLWMLFFLLLWGAVAAGAYYFNQRDIDNHVTGTNRGVLRSSLNLGYALLIVIQVFCIYLTQSRGPWLGLGAALVIFAVAMWLVGRRNNVRWMARIGRGVSVTVLAISLFIAVLNIPNSPLQSLNTLPGIGRGLERLSTLTRTEDGTGKVRTLIWKGATELIMSDPLRTLIGWGPEAMYVAYNPFYPPELAQVELRNATPDRSHNVEFDQMVTMGIMGLLAYYFLVGTFFFFAVMALKRARETGDQLLLIALISGMTAHFVEIQTGIQIAATWSYFYLFVGILVVFGYYMTGYLRPQAQVQVASANVEGHNAAAGTPVVLAAAVQSATSTRAGSRGNTAVATGEPGRATTEPVPARAQASRQPGTTSEARRRQAQINAQAQAARAMSTGSAWIANPVMLVLYAIVLVGALLTAWSVNTASVQADTIYKQGQAYDGAQRWPDSIALYQNAIALQPNQDYYYLFLGRAWLEFAKVADTEKQNDRTGAPYNSQADRDAEKLVRLKQSKVVLEKAHELNPLNTDHYANLGRLYLYWADPSGGNDPSKAQLAVDNFEKARERTPGNAQIADELAVAYARHDAFAKAIDTLIYSQTKIDHTYARTPFLRGQLYQERAAGVKASLLANQPLPQDGETDYGKLVIETAKAYSETIALDPGQFVDANYKQRLDYLLSASQPFTATNTKVDPHAVLDSLTNTLGLAAQNALQSDETQIASYLRDKGDYTGSAGVVPTSTLQTLWANPSMAAVASKGGTKGWLDPNFATLSHNTVLLYLAQSYIAKITGQPLRALQLLQRAEAIDPSDTQVQQALQSLQSGKP